MIPRIRQVHVQNYRSLAKAWVTLEPLTVLVGPNGTGKSNFVDALAFVKDCLSESISSALQKRGGFWWTRTRWFAPPESKSMGFRLVLDLESDIQADYAFELVEELNDTPAVRILRERCSVQSADGSHTFEVQGGEFTTPVPGIRPAVSPERLALTVVSAIKEFQPVYNFLTTMRFYSIVPERLREFRRSEPGDFLARDGSNAVAVLRRLIENGEQPGQLWHRINRLLSHISYGTDSISFAQFASKRPGASIEDADLLQTLMFLQNVGGGMHYSMEAVHMSDGSLRALALLLAAYQLGRHSLIAIEEPEATIHPAAAEVILQVLQDASHNRQMLITTHSPDILDNKDITDEQIRVVGMKDGYTFLSSVSESGRSIIRDKLYTPGELLRMNELDADEKMVNEMTKNFSLFGRLDLSEQGGE
ncbi:MAG: AAA family ATPase [bacterium]